MVDLRSDSEPEKSSLGMRVDAGRGDAMAAVQGSGGSSKTDCGNVGGADVGVAVGEKMLRIGVGTGGTIGTEMEVGQAEMGLELWSQGRLGSSIIGCGNVNGARTVGVAVGEK
ncbi:hypothetical protein NE237_023166 [Protea cynaroides]|uniref:Uncharacterized protein n=1 Tax=Protea cynaroides TaxID=273540 RepID=A0A9Q0K560_9MAGN|nr:hypothetical protein NE237_023166 [Protea cynaroides]